jgi:signal transduction histidine kinase
VTRLTRLLPRIYLVSLLQLLAIAGLTVMVGYLTFTPDRMHEHDRRSSYVVNTVAAELGKPEALQRELTRASAEMQMLMSVYAQDGTLVASNIEPPLVYTPSPRPPPPPPVPWLAPLFAPPLRPITRVGLAHDHPLLPGGYVVFRPPAPRARPSSAGLWLLGIALAATAVASIWLARSIARPITQLQAAAKRFGSGDLDARAELKRHDEFGELSRAFDDMAGRVTQLVRSRQELLANVSHELRTPLARIRVALDLAADGDTDIALQREALGEITEDCAELERLVADVLQSARLELAAGRKATILEQPLHIEPFDPAALVQKAAERFRNEHAGRALELRCTTTLPELHGDVVLLRRALQNLLDNAQKYSAPETPITLTAERNADTVELRVEDRGIGITSEDLPQVGTPFFRTDRSRTRRTGGIGLGLSLSRKIVEAHGGKLTIESEPDLGTRVCIRLPLLDGPAASEALTPSIH